MNIHIQPSRVNAGEGGGVHLLDNEFFFNVDPWLTEHSLLDTITWNMYKVLQSPSEFPVIQTSQEIMICLSVCREKIIVLNPQATCSLVSS